MSVYRYRPRAGAGRQGGIVLDVQADHLSGLFGGERMMLRPDDIGGPWLVDPPEIFSGVMIPASTLRTFEYIDSGTGAAFNCSFNFNRNLIEGGRTVNLSFLRATNLENGVRWTIEGLFPIEDIRRYCSAVPRFVKLLYDHYFRQIEISAEVPETRTARRAASTRGV